MNTKRTRYHVGMNEIGLDPEYRIECVGDLDVARTWLSADIWNTAEDIEDDTPFDVYFAKLDRIPDAEIVGEHHIDAWVFWVRAVIDCGCPCSCADDGRADQCNGEHNREAATEPQLSEPDEQDRSVFWFDRAHYAVFNTAGNALDGYWTVTALPANGEPPVPSRDNVLAGRQTRENAFALAVEKLRPRRHITFMPQRYPSVTDEDQNADEYPEVTRDGWVCAWSTAGYVVVFEDRVERGIIWPRKPIEASVAGKDGRQHDLDGEWTCYEQAAAAIRSHVLDSRA